MNKAKNIIRLKTAIPELANELYSLLMKQNEIKIAHQVDSLEIMELCGCNDDFCASFYTSPKPKESYGNSHYNIVLEPESGMIVLDIENEKIVFIEILYRDEIRSKINTVFHKKA